MKLQPNGYNILRKLKNSMIQQFNQFNLPLFKKKILSIMSLWFQEPK